MKFIPPMHLLQIQIIFNQHQILGEERNRHSIFTASQNTTLSSCVHNTTHFRLRSSICSACGTQLDLWIMLILCVFIHTSRKAY